MMMNPFKVLIEVVDFFLLFAAFFVSVASFDPCTLFEVLILFIFYFF